MIENWTFLFIT